MNLNQPESLYSSSGYVAPQQEPMGNYSQPPMLAYGSNYQPVSPTQSRHPSQVPTMVPPTQYPQQQQPAYGQPPMPSPQPYPTGFPPMGMMPPAAPGPQSMPQRTQSARAMADGLPNAIEVRSNVS